MSVFKNVADIQTSRICIKGSRAGSALPQHRLEAIRLSEGSVASLAERAEKSPQPRGGQQRMDNMLLITNDGRKLALDQRLVNPMLPSDPSSKAMKCAENVFGNMAAYRRRRRSTQMIFCDLSPLKDGQVPAFVIDIRAAGIGYSRKRNRLHPQRQSEVRKDLFGKVRSGPGAYPAGRHPAHGRQHQLPAKLVALHHLECR